MECRRGCGACCIAPSITSPLPGMPNGKPAGVICVNLNARTFECSIWGQKDFPDVCKKFLPHIDICATSREDALVRLTRLEQETKP